MKFSDLVVPTANVTIRAIDEHGKVIFEDKGHNVFTNHGREWLTASNRVVGVAPGPDGSRKVDTLPYYLTVGKGSDQQTVSPPGAGSQSESATVLYLENPVLYATGLYLAELDRGTTELDTYTNEYIRTFQETEISFGAQPSVPVTEFGLVTANAVATLPGGKKTAAGGPYPGTYDNGYLIAYRAVPPITKTANYKLQILWELRF